MEPSCWKAMRSATPCRSVRLPPARPHRRGRLLEQREIDRLRHRLVPGVAGMQVIAGIVEREEPRRMARVARGRVEVDDAVVGPAGTNPLIQRLSLGFAD